MRWGVGQRFYDDVLGAFSTHHVAELHDFSSRNNQHDPKCFKQLQATTRWLLRSGQTGTEIGLYRSLEFVARFANNEVFFSLETLISTPERSQKLNHFAVSHAERSGIWQHYFDAIAFANDALESHEIGARCATRSRYSAAMY